jgi:hypothetical protein
VRSCACLLLLLAVLPCHTQDPAPPAPPPDLKLEAEYKAEPGDFATVIPETKGKKVVWVPLDPIAGKLSVFPPNLAANPNALIVSAKVAGRYRFLALTAIGDQPAFAQTCIVVWVPEPPTPPLPPDTLKPLLQKAFDADPAPAVAKRAMVVSLAGFYEASADYASETGLQTTAALLEKLKSERPKFVPDASLVEVRKVIQAEQISLFSHAPDTKLDATMRQKAKELFARVATALMEVK